MATPNWCVASTTFLKLLLQRMKLFSLRGKQVLQLGIVVFQRLVVCNQRLQYFRDFRIGGGGRMPQLLELGCMSCVRKRNEIVTYIVLQLLEPLLGICENLLRQLLSMRSMHV